MYRGGGEYFYRLQIDAQPHIDYVFPLAAEPGGNRKFTIYGRNLPGGKSAGEHVLGRQMEQATVNVNVPQPDPNGVRLDGFVEPAAAGVDIFGYRVKGNGGASNEVPVGIASAPVVLEADNNDDPESAQNLSLPCEVQGRFYPIADSDWYQFEAKQGETYAIEIISQGMGLPTDPSLVLQQLTEVTKKDEEGNEIKETQIKTIATVDDSGEGDPDGILSSRSDDPVLLFEVPADATYRVLVREAYSMLREDPRLAYRLAIRKPKPDFRLAAAPKSTSGGLLLRKGEKAGIRVVVFRRDGFDGEVVVEAKGLPAGVSCPPITIGPANESGTLILSAGASAKPGSGQLEIVGTSQTSSGAVTRNAQLVTPVWIPDQQNRNQPRPTGLSRVAGNLTVAVTDA